MKIKMCDHIDVSGIRIDNLILFLQFVLLMRINLLLIHAKNVTMR